MSVDIENKVSSEDNRALVLTLVTGLVTIGIIALLLLM